MAGEKSGVDTQNRDRDTRKDSVAADFSRTPGRPASARLLGRKVSAWPSVASWVVITPASAQPAEPRE